MRVVRSPRWAAVAVASGALLAACSVVASQGVPHWEASLFVDLHDVPGWVDIAVWPPMQLGSAWAPPLVAGIAWWMTKQWRPTIGALVAGWGGWWLAKGVKGVIDRGRPLAELGQDVVRAPAVADGLGFVSGHATVAFACATILAPYLDRTWSTVAFALAIIVALSRVVVGAHLPLDVVGGAALGTLLAALWHLVVGVRTESTPA